MVNTEMGSVTAENIAEVLDKHGACSDEGICVTRASKAIAALITDRHAALVAEIEELELDLFERGTAEAEIDAACEGMGRYMCEARYLRAWMVRAKTAMHAVYHDPSCPDYPRCQTIKQVDPRVVGITCQCHCRELIILLNEEV